MDMHDTRGSDRGRNRTPHPTPDPVADIANQCFREGSLPLMFDRINALSYEMERRHHLEAQSQLERWTLPGMERRRALRPSHLIALLFLSAVAVAHNVGFMAGIKSIVQPQGQVFAHRSVLNSATAEQKDEDGERKGGTPSPGFVPPDNLRNVEARPRRNVSSSVLMTGVSPSNSDSHPLKFEVENLNLSIPAYCGEQKCFFRGKGSPPRFGYLLQQRDTEKDLAKGQQSYLLARSIEREYDARTLFGPVQLVNLTDNDASRLNVNLIKESDQMKLQENNYVRGKAVVYTVRMAAQPSLLVGTTEIRQNHAVSHLHEVLAASSDKASFLGNLRQEAEKAVALVRKVPCLASDFQAILDAFGRLWHIDFDRCFSYNKKKKEVNQHGNNETYTQEEIDGSIKPSLDLYIKTAEQIIAAMNDSEQKDEDGERKGGTPSPGFVPPDNLRNVKARPRRNVSSSVLMTGVSPSNSDSRALKFEVENLNLSIPAYCGEQKCFFRGKGSPPRFGYLLQQRDTEKDLAKGQQSYLLARSVEREYDARTLFGPVQLVNLTDNDASRLNVNLIKESDQMKLQENNYVRGKAVVYTVRMAAQPSLLVGTTEIRQKHAVSHLHEVLAASSDKASFLGNLRQEAEKAVALVRKVPCLASDFQAILDAFGRLWHIDFDRCFSYNKKKKEVNQHGNNETYTQEEIDGSIKPSLDLYIKTAEQIIAAMKDSNRG